MWICQWVLFSLKNDPGLTRSYPSKPPARQRILLNIECATVWKWQIETLIKIIQRQHNQYFPLSLMWCVWKLSWNLVKRKRKKNYSYLVHARQQSAMYSSNSRRLLHSDTLLPASSLNMHQTYFWLYQSTCKFPRSRKFDQIERRAEARATVTFVPTKQTLSQKLFVFFKLKNVNY